MRWQYLALAPLALVALPSAPDKLKPLDIDNYKTWHRVNKTPVKMSAHVAALCINPTAAQRKSTDPDSPHRDYFLRVYVSRAGKKFEEAKTPLPVGTVIVKEKLKTPEAKIPVLLTIMRKREHGYDPLHGDWEYAVADERRKVLEQGSIARCISCHETQKSTDYLYRSYTWQK